MKRKLFIIFLALTAVFAGIFGLAACGGSTEEEDEAPHGHTYGEWEITIPPTCEQSGERKRTCVVDGAFQIEKLPALGHNLEIHHDAKASTCYEAGWKAYDACTREGCGYSTKEDLPMLPHTYVNYTCTVPQCGHKMYEVSDDGYIMSFNDSTVTEVTVPSSVYGKAITGISDHAFADSNITSVTIEEGITTIISAAFENCNSLISVTIPNSVTTIGSGAFADCENIKYNPDPLTEADYLGNNSNEYLVFIKPWQSSINDIRISSKTKIVYSEAFSGCTNLERVELTDNLTYGSGLFAGCTGLKTVIFSDTMKEISDLMFMDCTNLESIEIPNSVTVIGMGAFSGCTGLEYVEIPSSVTTLGSGAFSDCTGLEYVEIPSSVTIIEGEAFSGCTSLKSIEIPDSVKTLGNGAFMGCTGLESIVLPNSITKIDNGMFSGCDNLKWVYVPRSVTEIGNEIFMAIDSNVKIYYAGSFEDWAKIKKSTIDNATIYLYSEDGEGPYQYWHGDKNTPVEWVKA